MTSLSEMPFNILIQQYLQSHFLNAMGHVAEAIHKAGDLEDTVVIGWESMNEPSMAWLGRHDLNKIPEEQRLRKGTCPSPFQAIATASGIAQTVQIWEFGFFGPKKTGTTIIDSNNTSIWIDRHFDDSRYGWQRGAGWKLGQCLWEQHGLWDSTEARLLRPDYFRRDPDGKTIDPAHFLCRYWMPHFRSFKAQLREIHNSAIIFCQPPVLQIPPVFTEEDRKDRRIVYSPHFVRHFW